MKATAHPVASHTTRPTTKSNSAPTTAKLRRRIAHSTAVVALTTKLIEATAVVRDLEPQQLVFSSSALLMSIWGTVLSGCWDSARVYCNFGYGVLKNIRFQALRSQKPCQRWVLYRSRISFAARNRRRPAAISAGKRNANTVHGP